MTPDQYVAAVLAKYDVPRGPGSLAERVANAIAGPIRRWTGDSLAGIRFSGSYAKGTGVRGVADIDLFISLKAETPGTLKEIYERLYTFAALQFWSPRKQNVSIGITHQEARVDLVPGRVQKGYRNYHSLYRRKADSWTQTNVALHEQTVVQSGRQREIRAIKIWRLLKGFDFPSLYLELFVIDALSHRRRDTLADNVLLALSAIGRSLPSKRVVDPANSANVLSDELTSAQKHAIALRAAASARASNWTSIIW